MFCRGLLQQEALQSVIYKEKHVFQAFSLKGWNFGLFVSPYLMFTAHYFPWVTEMWEMFDCRMENFLPGNFF